MDEERIEEAAEKSWADLAIEGGPGSEAFDVARKLGAVAAMLADEKQSPETAAAEADGAVFGQAQAYRVGKGELAAEEAAENVADRKAAGWISVARDWLAGWVQKGCVAAGTWIGGQLGNPVLGAQIGAAVGALLNKPVKKLIEKGLRAVESAAKKAWGWVKEKASGLFAKAREWLFA